MKLKLIPLLLGLGLTTSLSAADRMCFGQAPAATNSGLVAKITIADNDLYTQRKCSTFFPYYEKHVNFTQTECAANSDQITQDKGYAPFSVFFRGTDSTDKTDIASYDWTISSTNSAEVINYNGFNAAHIFDNPGDYTATLTITDKDGAQSTDTRNITVWPRDGKSYFVDSVEGDDRYNGLAQSPDSNCDANTAVTGSCTGPWKTATRAFGELAPRNVTSYPDGKYTADGICLAKETVDIVRYNQGNFKIFRSSTFVESEALKDSDGAYLPAIATELCTTLADTRTTKLRPGDQVLFNRGQTFDFETGVNSLTSYQAKNNGIQYNYERLDTKAISTIGHWSKAIGVSFGAYGQGIKPVIKNTGKVSSTALQLKGVGMFNLSINDLNFDLRSDSSNAFANRAIFATLTGNPNNISLQRVEVNNMMQGIVANSSTGSGLFIFNSKFHDSLVTQLYTQNSYNDVAIVNNSFDYSANHLIYSSIASGFIYQNKLSRPAFGRTALRVSGGSFINPNRYVWISDNEITGWIDPRTKTSFGDALNGRAFSNGLRYNYLLVDIAPNVSKDKALHDVTFTRNKVVDAETLLQLGATENINIFANVFQSADTGRTARISMDYITSRRPLKNIQIHDNKFIELATSLDTQSFSTSFINLRNYDRIKCSDQFNHEKINIENNTFYVPHGQRGIFRFIPLKQGKDELNNPLPNLTLDQAELFIKSQVTLANNQIFSPSSANTTLQIGGDFRANTLKLSNPDWSQFITGTSSTGGEYRLYNSSSQLYSSLGANLWATASSTTVDNIIAAINPISPVITPALTWDDLIAYAEDNNITPDQLEVMILNQVLASNPTYSMPGTDYSSDLPVFDAIGQWFSSIPSSMASLFSPEENKWNDAKQLATTNKVSNSTIMVSMTK